MKIEIAVFPLHTDWAKVFGDEYASRLSTFHRFRETMARRTFIDSADIRLQELKFRLVVSDSSIRETEAIKVIASMFSLALFPDFGQIAIEVNALQLSQICRMALDRNIDGSIREVSMEIKNEVCNMFSEYS